MAEVDVKVNSKSWEVLEPAYSVLLKTMKVDASAVAPVAEAISKLSASKARYQKVEEETGVDWALIAAIHMMEGSGDFSKTIRDGSPIKGSSWEDDSIQSLVEQGVVKIWEDNPVDSKKPEFAMWIAERWNGFGYRTRGLDLTPYLWAYTNHSDETGKYVKDGVYDDDAVTKQIGLAPLYIGLKGLKLEEPAKPDGQVVAPPETTVVVPVGNGSVLVSFTLKLNGVSGTPTSVEVIEAKVADIKTPAVQETSVRPKSLSELLVALLARIAERSKQKV